MADSKRIKLEKLEYDTIEIDEDLKEIIDNLAEAEDTDDCANEISEILERMDNGELEDNEDNADIREIQYRGVVEKTVDEAEELHKVRKRSVGYGRIIKFGAIVLIVVASVAVLWNTVFSDYRLNKIIQNSMEPTLMDGDLLIMENVTMDEIEVGDIITYRSTLEGNTIDITHRVVGKYEMIVNDSGITNSEVTDELRMQGYVGAKVLKTAGDNNEKPDDGWVTEDKIVGRIVYNLGSQTKMLIVLALAIVIVSNIISILISILNKSKSDFKGNKGN